MCARECVCVNVFGVSVCVCVSVCECVNEYECVCLSVTYLSVIRCNSNTLHIQ